MSASIQCLIAEAFWFCFQPLLQPLIRLKILNIILQMKMFTYNYIIKLANFNVSNELCFWLTSLPSLDSIIESGTRIGE